MTEKIFEGGDGGQNAEASAGVDKGGLNAEANSNSCESSQQGRAGIDDTTLSVPRVPSADQNPLPNNLPTKPVLYALLRQGQRLPDIALAHDTTPEILQNILAEADSATVSIDLSDEDKCKELRSNLLDTAKIIAAKIRQSNDSELSDPIRAKALETYAKALTTIQSGIINQMPSVTLQPSNETELLFEHLGVVNAESVKE